MAILFLFIICVGGCWLLFKTIGDALFGKTEKKDTYVDKSVHYHQHEHKNISIIDDETKKKVFELKESKKL